MEQPLDTGEGEGGVVYLATCMMSNVVPINVKLRMIVHMYQLMNQGVFHVLFIDKAVLTEKDSVLRTEAARELLVAWRA